jgi:hypothetical protein
MSYIALDDFFQYGVETAASVCVGNFQGGSVFGNEGGFKHEEGGAGQDDIVWDLDKPTASVQTVYKGESLLTSAMRTTFNALPPRVSFLGGVAATATLAMQVATAYVNTLKLACGGVGEAVKADYDLIALGATYTSATQGQLATATPTAPFVWQSGAVTINSAACRCQSFEVTVENGLTHDSSLDAKASGSQRVAEAIDVGSEKVSASFEVRVPPFLEFNRDTPTLPLDASIVIGNGYTLHTLTLRDLYFKPIETELLAGEDKHSWKIDCEAKYNSLKSNATSALSIA